MDGQGKGIRGKGRGMYPFEVADTVNVMVQFPTGTEYNLNGQIENFKVESAAPVSYFIYYCVVVFVIRG